MGHISILCLVLAVFLQVVVSKSITTLKYGIVIDAGSSGSRARVYSWTPRSSRDTVPDITQISSFKKKPGISEFTDNLEGIPDYISQLMEHCKENVPVSQHNVTPIYFMATGGMRFPLEEKSNALIDTIDSLLSSSMNSFQYDHLNTRILSGEEEGVFAWICVNYLNGLFDPSSGVTESIGILEFGGASTQIAFMPDGSILADKFPVTIGYTTYPIYVHSFLHYGQTYINLWVKEYLVESFGENVPEDIDNPCMLNGDTITDTIYSHNVTFHGTGDPVNCTRLMEILVYKDDDRCFPKPCSIGTVYQPSIEEDMMFYALSAFRFPLETIDALDEDGYFTLAHTIEAAYQYCSTPYDQVTNMTGRDDPFLSVECLGALYIPTLFGKAYGFTNTPQQLRAIKRLNGQPIEWPMGAMIYENERNSWFCDDGDDDSGEDTKDKPSSRADKINMSNHYLLISMCFYLIINANTLFPCNLANFYSFSVS